MPFRILFIHQNFPGQFLHLAPALAARGHEVRALGITGKPLPKVTLHPYKLQRGTSPQIHPLAAEFETKVIRGEACARAMLSLRDQGFRPDLVIAHPGWGEALFVKDVWPDARLLSFLEFYYAARGVDVGFDREFTRETFEDAARLRVKNANNLLALECTDWGLSPTEWQRASQPAHVRDRISVIFDGIDTDLVRPDPQVQLSIKQQAGPSVVLRPGEELVTFVNRNLEPYRGYHVFMRALPKILQARPQARVLLVGGDGVSYGAKPAQGGSWKQIFLDEVKDRLDLSRVHFMGHVPHGTFVKILQLSACHVYLTYPFVLSWSCIEALAAGCLVLGSRTPPVTEVITHGHNGLLVDFFDIDALADTVVDALARPEAYRELRERARLGAVQRYDLKSVCLPAQLALAETLAEGRVPEGARGA